MRQMILIGFLVFVPVLVAAAQDATTPEETLKPPATAAAVTQITDNSVVLTPIQPGADDLSLIDDVCGQHERRVHVYRLKHAPVADVAQAINQWLQARLNSKQAKVNGFICNAPVIMVPEVHSNRLIVSVSADFADTDALQQIIRELDRAPAMIQVQAVLKRTVNGQTTVLGSPHLIMLDNMQGSVTFGTPDEQFTVELTARIVPGPESTQTVPHSAANLKSAETKATQSK